MRIPSALKIILAIAIVAFITFYVVDKKDKDEMEIYIENYKAFKAKADSASHFADSLKVQIDRQETKASAAVGKANALQSEVKNLKHTTDDLKHTRDSLKEAITDSVELARKIIPAQELIITQQDSIIHKQETQVTHLNEAITLKDSTIYLLTISRDSLQNVIKNIPEPPKNPNKVFGVKLPSRKTVGIAGFIVGVITTAVILK